MEDSSLGNPTDQITYAFQTRVLEIKLTDEASCCICGREWEVQFVEVAILNDSTTVGILCPACLDQSPRSIAGRLEEEAHRLSVYFQQLHANMAQQSGDKTIPSDPEAIRTVMDHVRSRNDRLRETCRAIRENSARLRGATEARRSLVAGLNERYQQLLLESWELLERQPQLPSNRAEQLLEIVEQLEGVLVLAGHIKKLEQWPVSIEHLVKEERTYMKRRFPGLRDEHLHRLVDDRYHKFLSCSA